MCFQSMFRPLQTESQEMECQMKIKSFQISLEFQNSPTSTSFRPLQRNWKRLFFSFRIPSLVTRSVSMVRFKQLTPCVIVIIVLVVFSKLIFSPFDYVALKIITSCTTEIGHFSTLTLSSKKNILGKYHGFVTSGSKCAFFESKITFQKFIK